MITFPVNSLFIEGPDCSGKTTLIRKIHDKTAYQWHIHDRSQISRKIFADLYDRCISNIDYDLHAELSNLNNRFIFLLPSFDVIRERFLKRGDELHDSIESIEKVYNSFLSKRSFFEKFPNIQYYSRENTDEILLKVLSQLRENSHPSIQDISKQIIEFVKCNGGESYPLSFTIYDDCNFEEANSEILNYEPEAEYYAKIFKKLHDKITDELDGKNEYARKECIFSRRFVYTDSSCVSFIQVSLRDNVMDFHTVIRSSDVKEIFPHDLTFLYYLASTCFKRYFSQHDCFSARLRFDLNSAHIIR